MSQVRTKNTSTDKVCHGSKANRRKRSQYTENINSEINSGFQMRLDEIDQKILRNLLVDARLSARQLALKLGMATVTVLSRIKKLEKERVIKGYTALLDHEKLGYHLTAVIEVITKKDKIIQVEDEISKIENVCGVYDVTGDTDTLVIAKFKDRAELSKFVKDLSSIPNIENTITHVVLNTVKEDFRLS